MATLWTKSKKRKKLKLIGMVTINQSTATRMHVESKIMNIKIHGDGNHNYEFDLTSADLERVVELYWEMKGIKPKL